VVPLVAPTGQMQNSMDQARKTSRSRQLTFRISVQRHCSSRKKTSKNELKSIRDLSIKEEGEGSGSLIKGSTTIDLEDEKEKKKDRELQAK
jgi:hypothetical protein